MLWTFSISALRDVSSQTYSAASVLPAAILVFLANPPASPAPQARAILLLEAILPLLALLVLLGPTVDPASQAAATAPQAHTALIPPEVL
jgi:hypothetical protein